MLIEQLTDSSVIFSVKFNNESQNMFNPKTREIYWDPTTALILGDGKSVMSPARGLAHEMGHAAQYLNGDFNEILESTRVTTKQRMQIEEDNLLKYETPVGTELGEYNRKNYSDASGRYKLYDPTDWGHLETVYSKWAYLWPLNWGKPSKRFRWENNDCNW